MLPLELSAIPLTCIKRYSILKIIFGLLFEWPLKTGDTEGSKYIKIELKTSLDVSNKNDNSRNIMSYISSQLKVDLEENLAL